MSDIDVRLLQTESLSDAVFPGGRNEAYRVYFAPEVHRALWAHAGEDTSVEVCGVLIGTWHRDEVGPFATIVDSIRGEGATTKFAEVTFTHQTWAKINAEMDTRFADKKIVGWYHTHPDFGIFLSDRDRFIQEHFFSGPGQVAHVIDPLRKLEGVFIWRGGKPTLADHFWVGDRVLTAAAAESAPGAVAGAAAGQSPGSATGASGERDGLLPPPARLMMYLAIFLAGYLLSMSVAAWERQGMIEAEVRSNGALLLLRLGLGGEIDRLQEDLYAAGRLLPDARGASKQADRAFEDVRTRLTAVSQRAAIVKERYANTPAVERELTYLLDSMARERSVRSEATRPPAAPDHKGETGTSAAGSQPPSTSSSPMPGGEPKKP